MPRPSSSPIISVSYEGKDRPAVDRQAKSQGTSGGIYVPRDWIGKRVLCILLDK